MMESDSRILKQQEGLYQWQHSIHYGSCKQGVGSFIWPTGMGKTHVGCMLINNIKKKNPDASILILVPFIALVNDWKLRVEHLVENKSNIEVMTVQLYVLNKYYKSPTLLIIDELDEFYSEERIKIITKASCNYTFVLGLTATPEDKRSRHHKVLEYIPVVHRITEEEALANGWISDFEQFNLKIDLNETEREEYDQLTERIGVGNGKFNTFQQALDCLAGNKVTGDTPYIVALKHAMSNGWRNDLDLSRQEHVETNNMWNPNKIMGYAKSLIEATRLRNDLLNHCEARYTTVLKIIHKFYNVKTIIFSQSINYANKIHLLINEEFQQKDNLFDSNYPYCVLYHSNLSATNVFVAEKNKKVKYGVKRLKEYNLNLIKTGQAKVIAAAKALDKGLDIKDIRLAILVNGDSTTNRQRQREGRAKRIEDLPYEIPVIIINLYCIDTKEEYSLRNRQNKSVKSKIHPIDNVDEINLDIEKTKHEKNKIKFNI